ncbi:SwmB domain-containing protein [Candidatus Poriferisocius sp.]|uniref:SwmB domain-containing protein n=1 Tax=Candidatus Poriferisocius sp. TaxID=3101276 RepID=UPI003B01E2B4
MSAEVDGTRLAMEFNQSLNTAVVPAPGDFTVTVTASDGTSSSRSVASGGVAISGKKVTLTLSSAVTFGQTVTVGYTKPTGATAMPLENTSNVDVETFGAQPVTNVTAPVISSIEIVSRPRNSEQVNPGPPPELLPTYLTGQPIVVAVTWNGPVAWDLSAASAGIGVQVTIGSNKRRAELVTDGETSGTASTLWFSYTVVAGDTDTDGVAVETPGGTNNNKDRVVRLRNGATLKGAAGTDAAEKNAGVDFAAGLSAQSGHRVKGSLGNAAGNTGPKFDDDDNPSTDPVDTADLGSVNLSSGVTSQHRSIKAKMSDADNDTLRYTVTATRPEALNLHLINEIGWFFQSHDACVLEDLTPPLLVNDDGKFENVVTLEAFDPDGASATLTSTLETSWHCGEFVSASVNGATMTITFNSRLESSFAETGAADQFEIEVDGATAQLASVNPVTRSSDRLSLVLTLATAVTRNQEVTASFTPLKPAVRPFTDQPVVNARNTVPSSAAVSGNTMTVTFNRDVSIESGGAAADLARAFSATGMHWSVDEDNDNTPDGSIPLRRVAPESVSISGAVVTLTFGSNIVPSKQVTVDYYSGIAQTAGSGLLDADSIRVPSVSGQAVTATVPATAPPRLVSGQVAGTELTLTFDGDLDSSSAPPGSRFRVEADPVDFFQPVRPIRGTGTATVSGKTATVTLASAVAEGERAAVWYEPLSTDTSPLRGASSGPKVIDIWDTVISVADRTAPTIVDSVLEGTTLVLYYSEELDTSSVPSLSGGLSALAFLLAPHGTTNFFVASDIAVHDDAVTLTLPTRTESAFGLDYTVLTENAIQDVAGNKAAAFSRRRLDRSITSDPGAPSLAAASPAVADQNVLRLTFNRALDPSKVPSADAFTIGDSVLGTNHGQAITDVAIRGTKVELTISPGFLPCRKGISVSYTAPDDNALSNLWGTDAASFSDQAVTNQQSSRCVRTPVSASPMGNSGLQGNSGTDRVGLSFDRSMHQQVPDPVGFTVRARTPRGAPAAPVEVESVQFSPGGRQLQVALSRTLGPGEEATVNYQHPRSGPGLWDSDGNQIAPFSASTVVPATSPTVTGVEVVSDAGVHDTYAMGQVIRIRVTFSEAVDVSGTPTLGIDMDPAHWGRKDATYASGSGTAELTFNHQVAEPNFSSQGIAVLADTLALGGGTIRSSASQADADLSHTGLGHDQSHKVDWRQSPPDANGNRAPVFAGTSKNHDNALPETWVSLTVSKDDFSDPDGDELSFTLSASRDDIYGPDGYGYIEGYGRIWFRAKTACALALLDPPTGGKFDTVITLTATDPSGASASATATFRTHQVAYACPTFSSAAVDGATVTITLAADGLMPPTYDPPTADELEVKVDGTAVALADTDPVSASGTTIVLALASPVTAGQTVTVSYIPGPGPMAAAFADQAVTNNTPVPEEPAAPAVPKKVETPEEPEAGDCTPDLNGPMTPVCATVSGNELTLTFNRDLAAISGSAARSLRWAFLVDGAYHQGTPVNSQSPSGVTVDGNTLTLTLGTAVAPGDDATVSYYASAAGNALQDADGTPLTDFTFTATTTTPE